MAESHNPGPSNFHNNDKISRLLIKTLRNNASELQYPIKQYLNVIRANKYPEYYFEYLNISFQILMSFQTDPDDDNSVSNEIVSKYYQSKQYPIWFFSHKIKPI